MNFRTAILCSALCLFAVLLIPVSAEVAAPYEVGTWGNFAQGAVSFTFDDNTPNQIAVAQPLFDEKGFHMTMFLVIKWGPNWENYKAAFAKGHEIASHSITHPQTMPASEAGPSQDTIKKNVPGEMCVSIAYPNCNEPDEQTLKKYYITGRICQGSANTKTPSNMFKISSNICGTQGLNSTQQMTAQADQAATSSGWCVYLMHGLDTEPQGSSDYSPLSSSILKGVITYLDANRGKLWVESMGNVARYIRERDAVSVAKKDSSDKGITLNVTDNLADSIFNYPLTIRRPLPDGWTTAVVTQKDKPVEDSVVTSGSKKYIMFKAMPDGGDVVISKTPTAVKKNRFGFNSCGAAPVRFARGTLLIDSHQFNGSAIQVTLFDIRGKVLVRHAVTGAQAGFALPIDRFTASAFIAKATGGGKSWSGMIVSQM
jgi:hypothetical protein